MARPTQTMEQMVGEMNQRRKALNRTETAIYQYDGTDKFSVLYYNQLRDAAFAKAKLPAFGDGSVPYVPPSEPTYDLPVRPVGMAADLWKQLYGYQYNEMWKEWYKKDSNVDNNYLEACGIILQMLGAEPLTQVQQYTTITNGQERFIAISEVLRRKYYPRTNYEIEIMTEWISKSTDEYGIKVWFSLWQEAIDLLTLVQPGSVPSNSDLLRYMETGMTNRTMKIYFGNVKEAMVPNVPAIAGVLPGAMRSRTWDQVRDQLITSLDADPDIEAHLISLPKSRGVTSKLTAMVTTVINGACWNCGVKGHQMSDCKSLSCGKCGKTWASESSSGFHRMYNRQLCPAQANKPYSSSYQPTSSTRSPYKRLQPTQTTSTTQQVPRKVLNAKVRDGRTQGFKAAVAMMKEGKSIKDLEDAVLGKHKRSA
jgi:Zinc knuckle